MAVELEERFYETNRAQLFRWAPWLHLFRAFRIALDVRKLVLGALAAFLLAQGDRLIDALPFASAPRPSIGVARTQDWPWSGALRTSPIGESRRRESDRAGWWAARWPDLLFPVARMAEPGTRLFARG